MIRQCLIRPAAQAEIDDQADFLDEHAGEAVAHRFLVAVDETIEFLRTMPEVGPLWVSDHPQLQGVRRYPVKGFKNLLLFYRATGAMLDVLHLYHGAQNIDSRMEADEETSET